jgi:LPS O-antigen subunit length determinant protein (WzzB/FepE family)
VEVVLNSRDLARQVLLKGDLYSSLFPGNWNPEKGGEDPTTPGNMDSGIRRLRDMVSTKADMYKMTLEIRVRASNPELAYKVTRNYLEALNERMKVNVIRNADENREFLEGQLSRTYDPISKEKIQGLIIQQMEKAILLNANAFEVLEAPEKPLMRESPHRKKILMFSFGVGFLASCLGILALRGLGNLTAETKILPD